MPRDTGIANRLRAAGLKVVEVAGWKTRGSETFNPRGSVDHHTAGPLRGNAPSLGICINGRSDLPGPLCHVLVGRDLTCYVIAAGRANHAGLGGWSGLAGNSSVYGVERENVGTSAEPWTPAQTEHAVNLHRALLNGKPAINLCRHAEWAPTRKIDTHSLSGRTLRIAVAAASTPEPAPPKPTPPEDEDDMAAPVFYIYFKDNRDPAANYRRYADVSEKPLVEGVHIYACSGGFGVHQGPESMVIADYLNGATGLAKIGSAEKPTTILVDGKANGWFTGFHLVDGPLAGIKL